ncbi:MAG: hypothetical protein WBQ04_00635 [Candidatus Acidiferrales bacterium]
MKQIDFVVALPGRAEKHVRARRFARPRSRNGHPLDEHARVRALAAYNDFLALWKDADPNIPILKEAKAEYAKLQ